MWEKLTEEKRKEVMSDLSQVLGNDESHDLELKIAAITGHTPLHLRGEEIPKLTDEEIYSTVQQIGSERIKRILHGPYAAAWRATVDRAIGRLQSKNPKKEISVSRIGSRGLTTGEKK